MWVGGLGGKESGHVGCVFVYVCFTQHSLQWEAQHWVAPGESVGLQRQNIISISDFKMTLHLQVILLFH